MELILRKTYRGLSIGAWLMLIAVIVGVPFLILGAFLVFVAGLTPFAIAAPAQQPLLLILLAVAGIFTLLAGVLFIIGLAIYVIVPSLSPETARIDYASYRTVVACFLLAIVIASLLQGIYLAGEIVVAVAGGPSPLRGELTPTMLLAAMVSTEISLLLVLWIRIIRPGVISWRDMGLTTAHLGQRLLIGIATGFAIFVGAGIIEFILSQLGIQQTQISQFEPVKNASLLEFVLLLLAGAVLAPFVEEMFFRGYIFKGVTVQKGLVQGYLSSALIFAAAHGNVQAALPIFVIGLILAYVFRHTESVIPTMIGHAINNGIAFIVLYLGVTS